VAKSNTKTKAVAPSNATEAKLPRNVEERSRNELVAQFLPPGVTLTDWRSVPDRSKRGAIYARYSTAEQSDKSCQDQIREAAERLNAHGIAVTHVFLDEKTRARAWKARLGFAEAMRIGELEEYGVIAIENVSRFARQALKGAARLAMFADHEIQIFDCLSGMLYDLNDGMHVSMIQNMLSWAENETKGRSQMTRRGHRGLARAGFWTGGRAPLGYVSVKEPGQTHPVLKPDPNQEAQRLAQRLFELFDKGVSASSIGRMPEIVEPYLRIRRTKKPSNRKLLPYLSEATIHSILENPVYVGRRIWGQHGRTGKLDEYSGRNRTKAQPAERTEDVPEFCDPLIALDLFERVQRRRDANAQQCRERGIANAGRGHLLSGLVKCASCGFAFVINAGGKNKPTYTCTARKQLGSDGCINKCSVLRAALEAKVKHVIETMVKDPDALAKLVERHNDEIDKANDGQLATVKSLERQLAEQQLKAQNLGGEIAIAPSRTLRSMLDATEQHVAELENRLAQARSALQPHLVVHRVLDFEVGEGSLFTGALVEDRALIHDLVESIQVHPTGFLVMQLRKETFLANVSQVMFDVSEPQPMLDEVRAEHRASYFDAVEIAEQHGRRVVPGGVLMVKNGRFHYALRTGESDRRDVLDALESASRKTLATPTGRNAIGRRPSRLSERFSRLGRCHYATGAAGRIQQGYRREEVRGHTASHMGPRRTHRAPTEIVTDFGFAISSRAARVRHYAPRRTR